MTGPCDDYTDQDVDQIVRKMAAGFQHWSPGGETFKVRARIQWLGEYNRQPVRSTSIIGVHLVPVHAATMAAMELLGGFRAAGQRKGPKTWGAQFRALSSTQAGYEAMRAAGVSATIETQQRWLTGRQEPGKKNRDAIAEAQRRIHEDRVTAARSRYMRAAWHAVETMQHEVEEVTQAEVRFFDPDYFDFS